MPEGGAPPQIAIRTKAIEEGTKYGVVGGVEALACEQHQRPFLPKRVGEYFKGVS